MKKIVFLTHDPGGLDVVKPVYEYLKEQAEIPVQLFCIGPSGHLHPGSSIEEDVFFDILFNLISMDEIAMLITGTSWGSDTELQAIQQCQCNCVATISILDYWSNYALRFADNDNSKFIFPDYYIVMDELARTEAISEGVPAEIIHALGHSGLDRFIQKKHIVGATHSEHRALFLSQPLSQLYGDTLGYTEQSTLSEVYNLFKGLSNWNLHIKFHPKDSIDLQRQYDHISVSGQLEVIIPEFDIIIGMNSIGLLHAYLLGREILSFQPNLSKPDLCITNKLGFSKVILDSRALLERIHSPVELHTNEDIYDIKHIWQDGMSTKRIGNFAKRVYLEYAN